MSVTLPDESVQQCSCTASTKPTIEQSAVPTATANAAAVSTADTSSTTAAAIDFGTLYRFIQWSDSMLPVGGFSFSCALEAAVQTGMVHDVTTLHDFTATALAQSAHGDAIALAHAHTLTVQDDWQALLALDAAVFSRKLIEENRTMSLRMGRKLLDLYMDIMNDPTLPASSMALRFAVATRNKETHGTWPVAQGIIFAAVGLGKEYALTAHQYSVAVTILNAALRLMRVTHIQTQRILFCLASDIQAQCRMASQASLGQMCSFAPVTDILGSVHTRAHVRLFMS